MKRLVLIVLWIIISSPLFAQNWNGGIIVGGDYNKTFKSGIKMIIEEEIRWTGSTIHFDRSKTSIGLDYKIFGKNLRVGGQFDYIFKNKWDNFENRYRVQCNLSLTKKLKRIEFQNKLAIQTNFYDKSRGYFKLNPELYLREKVKFEYGIFHKPIKIGLSFEFFYSLNNPKQNIIDELRSELYCNYRFNKQNEITLFVRADKEIQIAEPDNILFFGIQYHMKN